MHSSLESLPLQAPAREAFFGLLSALRSQTHLPTATLGLCHLRLAQLHRLSDWRELATAAVAPQQIDHLQQWPKHAAFDTGERACLAFTEVYAADAQAVTDELADGVKAHFGDAGLVALIEGLGLLDGMLRTQLLWQSLGAVDND